MVNGIFLVAKCNQQRIIITAKNANMVFREHTKVDLPNPDKLTKLCLPKGKTLVVSKSDIDNYYHRMKIPSWMTQMFGLMAVEIDGKCGV